MVWIDEGDLSLWSAPRRKTRGGERRYSDLTTEDVGDPTALPNLLDQVEGSVDTFIADGAYDGEPISALLAARFGSTIAVTIPPPINATLSPYTAHNPTTRDTHITEIAAHGRIAWQKARVTINAAVVKRRWAGGRPSLGQS